MSNMSNKKIYFIIITLVLVFAAIGSAVLVVNQKKLDGYVKTKAYVVDYVEKREFDHDDGRYKYMYAEIVEYTVDGIKYSAKNNAYSNAPKRIGGSIEIAYDPNSPSNCIFVKNTYLLPFIFFIMSGALILCCIIKFVADCVKND